MTCTICWTNLANNIFNFKENERTRSFDLVKNLKNNDSSIKIVVFDIINYDGTSYEKSLWDEKKELINKLFSNGKNIFSIDLIICIDNHSVWMLESSYQSRIKAFNADLWQTHWIFSTKFQLLSETTYVNAI